MARNGSGTYTKINTFASNNPITASGHNQNWDDIATEITNSVAADGQTSMTGPLKAVSGTVSAPGLTFASDPNTGIYRIGADNLGIAANGAKVVDVATTGVTVTGDISATALKQSGFSTLLVGEIKIYAGSSAPSGYLFCYGQAVSRTTYSALFAALGTVHGAGDGTTTFNVPDIRGRVIAGKDDIGGSSSNRLTNANDGVDGDVLGAAGGGETQTLVTGNLPAYTPTGSVSAPTITPSPAGSVITNSSVVGNSTPAGGGSSLSPSSAGSFAGSTLSASAPTFTGTAQGGTSTAFGIVQPTIILNYIIFAGV